MSDFSKVDAVISGVAYAVQSVNGCAPTQLGEFVDGGAGLFEVFQRAVGSQGGGGRGGLLDAPTAVGVHPHRRDQCAHRVDPVDVVGQRLARLGDLHLGGVGTGEPVQHLGHLSGRDGGHGGVDRDAVA